MEEEEVPPHLSVYMSQGDFGRFVFHLIIKFYLSLKKLSCKVSVAMESMSRDC